jgi:uncharacterized membrane protein
MEYLNTTMIMSVLIGISLAACTGFRVFLPMLISSLAFKLGWITPIESLSWLGSYWALVIFLVAAVFETLAFLVPWIDHAFDMIAAPLAVLAGAVLASAMIKDMPLTMQVGLGIIAGGGTAGAVHATTSILRLGSTKFTGGMGNPFFAKLESLVAVIGTLLAIFIPIIMILFLLCFFILAYKLITKFVLKSKPQN